MRAIWERGWVIGTGLALGCLCSAYTAVAGIPASASAGDRLISFVGMMAGPFFAASIDLTHMLNYSPIGGWVALGFLSAPLIAVHPVKPHGLTACISAFGFLAWFWAGFLTVVVGWYGA